MMNKGILLALALGLSGCATHYNDTAQVISITGYILSLKAYRVEYKVQMDSEAYSPGINIKHGKIIFPKCPLRKECVVDFKSEPDRLNRYTMYIKDKRIVKKLEKMWLKKK